MSLRTNMMNLEYQAAIAGGTLIDINKEAPIREWDYWKLVVNRFWHDEICVFGLMVVLKRECPVIWEVTDEESSELFRVIGPWLDKRFHTITINLAAMRSVNNIPHIQVYILKKEYQ